jgi:hypothetical protein
VLIVAKKPVALVRDEPCGFEKTAQARTISRIFTSYFTL